ncbi:MAG: hydrogenase iron-sulfur subunit [Candidatus Lokiarchaeota archaeon]|nr:hydrogenase iron-sulfur subunit [Candidatus Lokiarchaeota archaeon]
MSFEPKILGFLCNWCSYAGADLAGVSRIQYPTNIRVIRVMCSGRVDPSFVADAFINGIDGVLVLGCHLGDCHYLTGNYEAEIKMKALSKLLALIDFSNRMRLDWVSASEGNKFAQIVSEFTNHIQKLGPSPLKEKQKKPEFFDSLQAVKNVLDDSRLRGLIARQRELVTDENVYGEQISAERFDILINDVIRNEFIRHKIIIKIKEKGKSVPTIANEINIKASEVLEHIVVLRARGLVDVAEINEEIPTFISIMGG